MQHLTASRQPLVPAAITVMMAGAMVLTPTITTPAVQHLQSASHAISSRPVVLTDNWALLFQGIGQDVTALLAEANAGLPATSNPIAPIAEQAVINVATYAGQLITGQGGKIPGEVASHLTKVVAAVKAGATQFMTLLNQIPPFIQGELTSAWQYITAHNPLNALLEAPAFLIATMWAIPAKFVEISLMTRNAIAKAIDPPLPKWLSWLAPTTKHTAPPLATAATTTAAATRPTAHVGI